MTAMRNPHLLDDLAYELRRGPEWPCPPWLAPTLPLAPRTKHPPPAPPPPPPEPPTLTYEPHPEYRFRVHAYLGGRWLGDLVAFPTGYRAYRPDDTPVPGLWADRETAARALEVGR